MELVPEMTFSAMLNPPMAVGAGPMGTRMVLDVIGGRIEGPRISGSFKGGLVEMNEKVDAALAAAQGTDFGDQYF